MCIDAYSPCMGDTPTESRTNDPVDRSGNGDRLSWMERLLRLLGIQMSTQGALEQERLEAAIQRLRVQLDVGSEEPVPDWLDRARRHLADATQRLANRQFSAGWTSLNAARRESVWGLDPTCARLEAIRVYHESAEKLSSWRERSSKDLLKLKDGEVAAQELEDLKARIVKARETLDERNDNMYRKLRLLGHQLRMAAVQLAVGLAGLVAVVAAGWAEVPEDSVVVEDWRLLVAVITVGWVAAVVSSVVALGRRDAAERVPSLRRSGMHMLLRPLGGSASAVLVVALVQTGLGGNVDVEGAAIYAVAISAGFTELLISRAIGNAQEQLRS